MEMSNDYHCVFHYRIYADGVLFIMGEYVGKPIDFVLWLNGFTADGDTVEYHRI